jgi:hypothetical protein
MNEQAFFDTVIALKNTISEDKFIHVNVMNEFWNQDRIAYYQKLLEDNRINHYLNQLNYSFQTRTIPIMKGKLNLAIP